MTWGKMVRQALQACAQKCELILHFFFFSLLPPLLYVTAPLFFLRKSDMFVAPTALVMERSLRRQSTHVVKECLSAEWRALLPLPPRPINLD